MGNIIKYNNSKQKYLRNITHSGGSVVINSFMVSFFINHTKMAIPRPYDEPA